MMFAAGNAMIDNYYGCFLRQAGAKMNGGG